MEHTGGILGEFSEANIIMLTLYVEALMHIVCQMFTLSYAGHDSKLNWKGMGNTLRFSEALLCMQARV